MKKTIPKDNTEIVTSIMSLFDEMTHLKDDIQQCQKAISDHADEARASNKIMNDTVLNLQFSVTGLKDNVAVMQEAIKRLTELSSSLVTIGNFIVKTSKVIASIIGLVVAVIAIKQYLG